VLLEQLTRCLAGLLEGLLWLFLLIIAALGYFLFHIGFTGTGWLIMLGVALFAASAFKGRG